MKSNRKTNKLCAFLLSLAMVFSLFSGFAGSVWADDAQAGAEFPADIAADASALTETAAESGNEAGEVQTAGAIQMSAFSEINTLAADTNFWIDTAPDAVEGTDYTTVSAIAIEIKTAEGLAHLANEVNNGNDYTGMTVTLANNIDLSGKQWTSIGIFETPHDPAEADNRIFNGTFDGNKKYIMNMTMDDSIYDFGGSHEAGNALFAVLGPQGVIKNVGVYGINVKAGRVTAGIVSANYGIVTDCMAAGTIQDNGRGQVIRGAGGIVGNNYGKIENCYSNVKIHNIAGGLAGGIAGANMVSGTIDNCLFTGYASSERLTYSGSIAATNKNVDEGSVTNCYYPANSALDKQENGCPAGYAGKASATEFNSLDTASSIADELGGSFKALDGDKTFPVLDWESEYHHDEGLALPAVDFTFQVSPADATIELTDSTGKVIEQKSAAEGARIYTLVVGETHGYLVKHDGYETSTGNITPGEAMMSATITLSASGSGAGGVGGIGGGSYTVTGFSGAGGLVSVDKPTAAAGDTVTLTVKPDPGFALESLSVSGGAELDKTVNRVTESYTFKMPSGNVTFTVEFLEAALIINTQQGNNGATVKAAVYTKAELTPLAGNTRKNAYLYINHDRNGWTAIVSSQLVELDTLLNNAGVRAYWRSGAYLNFVCNDGVYGLSHPTYNEIQNSRYYYETDDTNNGTEVPAGIALKWDSGDVTANRKNGVDALYRSAYDSGSLRFVYGVSPQSYQGPNYAAGARSPSGVLEMTIVYEGSAPSGSVGTTHAGGSVALGNEAEKSLPINTAVTESKDAGGNTIVQASVTVDTINTALKTIAENTALQIDAVSKDGGAMSALVTIPVAGITAATGKKAGIIVKADIGLASFDVNSLSTAAKAAGSGNITVSMSDVTKSAESGMNDRQAATAGGNTVIRLEMKDGKGNDIGNFGSGRATVSINYTAANPGSTLKVYRVNDDGSKTDMNATYANGLVKWNTSSFSFYMIAEELTAIAMSFTDVKAGDWFYDNVAYVYQNQLMSGTNTAPMMFSPNATLTRGMAVTVLYRAAGSPDALGLANPFTDVTSGTWYTDAVKWAAANDIVSGMGAGGFAPNAQITREQAAVIFRQYALFRGKQVNADGAELDFADKASISGWAGEAVSFCSASNVITGKSGGLFDPKGNATRAEYAAMIHRFTESVMAGAE